jgi:hypothetical protein
MTDLLHLVLKGDQFVLFVLLSFSLGSGIVSGRGYVKLFGDNLFAGFWDSYFFMTVWSVGTGLILYFLGPLAFALMVTFLPYVLGANLLTLAITSSILANQLSMGERAKVGVILLLVLTGVALVLAYLYSNQLGPF